MIQKTSPIAVLISDIHYNINTLQLADAALNQAIRKAEQLGVPLVIAGDLHDTKANLRAECVNKMVATIGGAVCSIYILVGNHDKINEKADLSENSLLFLRQIAGVTLIDSSFEELPAQEDVRLIPYQSDPELLRNALSSIPKDAILIMHQGIEGSDSGEYIKDHSALKPQDVAGRRVISGHYHKRQTIKLPGSGKWDYIGNPFTLNYGEAEDPPKGYQILHNDGSLHFVCTRLRRHVVLRIELHNSIYQVTGKVPLEDITPNDLVTIKFTGTKEQLSKVTRKLIAGVTGLDTFKLDLLPTETSTEPVIASVSQPELLDSLIDAVSDIPADRKAAIKQLWRSLG